MKRITLRLVAVVILAGIIAFTAPASLHADASAAPIFVTQIPPGYRDWRLISVSHEAGNLNSIGAVLGNDVAIKALRRGEASIPGRQDHCRSALRSRPVGGKQQGLWPSPIFRPWPSNEHSVYGQRLHEVPATGRWGFATFIDGKPAAAATMKSCFPCHNQAKASDLVFTHYAP
jgi:hypothetical protein